METRTITVEIARDGTLKLPPDFQRTLGDSRELSVTRIGSSLVLAPLPENWAHPSGRVTHYENGLVVRDPKVMFGTPVLAGTRIPVRTIWGYLDSGYSPAQIRLEFPFLTLEQIEAAKRFQKRIRFRPPLNV
ncbi:MAG: DUF433 domain-containing protein [Chloroflexi bacterium]|nr:DUF433 domain-containing protein [Chloroflexota bacterium]